MPGKADARAGDPGGAAAVQEKSSGRSSSRSADQPQGPALRLVIKPPQLYEAHADLRAAVDAARAGLIDPGTGVHLAMRAHERIRAAQTGLPVPRARDRDPARRGPWKQNVEQPLPGALEVVR